MTLQPKLVVGLGNPGRQYAKTRHNVGIWCVERLAKDSTIAFSRRYRLAVVGEGTVGGREVAVAKSRTFVNDSGRAVTSLLGRYRASAEDLLVVYDDMSLSPGQVRVRPSGGSGGHNGMKSIIGAIGTKEFARVRVGIGFPPADLDEVQYVLGTMPPEERRKVNGAVERAAQAIVCVISEGIEAAMNRFN